LKVAHSIVDALEDKKGEHIILIDIHEIAIFAEYFVICSGTSDRMIQTLADSAIENVKKEFGLRGRLEGLPQDGWMLVDFGDVIVHIFSPDRRDFYRLEDLWSGGKVLLHLQ
jgi:ribosome-associated protein